MPGSGPSGVGNSISLTVVHSTTVSVSGPSNSPVSPSSTHFLSSSLSSSTSNSATAIIISNKLLATSQSPQTTTSSASSPSASSVGHIDSSPISSSVTSTASANGLDVSHAAVLPDASSSVAYTKAVSSTLPTTTTSSSTTPAAYDPTSLGSTSSSLITQSGYMSLAPVPAALDASATWAASFANHEDHATGASTSNSAPEPTTRVPTSNPTYVSSIVSGATISTESAGTSAHIVFKPPKAPQQVVSASIPVNTQTTQSGSNLLTTTSGSLVALPTTSGNVYPNSSPVSISNSLLPLILGPVLGVLVIVVLGMIVFRCHARRRSENMSNVLSSGSRASRDRKDCMMIEDTPQVNAVTLGRRITSYRGSSIPAQEHIITHFSHAAESSQNSNGQYSNPFADSSEIVSSRTSMLPASIHSVESVSTNLAFTVSANADARDVGEFESSIDASTSSLELHFVPPLATDDPSTPSSYLSPSWHYNCQSPTSSPREGEYWNEEQQGEGSPVSLQASPPVTPKPFLLGSESARLRLHALLKEARGISYEQESGKCTVTLQK